MSGVTAEDVLAAALLDDLWDSEDSTPTLSEMVPANVVPVYMDAWEEYGNEWILPVSEACYQLECARRAVVVAAEHAVDGRLGLGRRMGVAAQRRPWPTRGPSAVAAPEDVDRAHVSGGDSMKRHKCAERVACRCYAAALEPDDNCPIHGSPWPPRCATCGRFIPVRAAMVAVRAAAQRPGPSKETNT